MSDHRSLIATTLSIGLFILLEVCAVLTIVNNGIIQKFKAVSYLRDVQNFFWEKEAGIDRFIHYRIDNEALVAENIRLRNEISAYRRHLEEGVDTLHSADGKYTYVSARVIRNVVNSQHNYLVLDKGADDGISQGMGVITPSGVVGIVDNATRNYCSVISFLNSNQNVSVRMTKSGMFGPMSWDGVSTSGGILRGIPAYVEASVGDSLVTSGYSTIYPPDIPVGTVTGTTVVNGLLQNIEIQLFEDFRAIRDVYVVMDGDRDELNLLMPDEQ